MDQLRVAIVGASGYTGAELVRLCLAHPRIQITGLFAQRSAGDSIFKSFPQLIGAKLPSLLRRFEAADVAAEADVALLALPHGESVPAARALVSLGVTVLDLSADFRLRDPGVYAAWYGPHGAPELLPEAVYGLVERHRSQLQARPKLVAVPGCYPTATLLALAPLLARGLISPRGLIVDAKSGVSGAGRTPGLATHFPEAGEGVKAYKVAEHRHTPEIEQELTLASGSEVRLTFTPHLIPMVRGILSTCYANPVEPGRPRSDYLDALRETYQHEPFVSVVDHPPDTAHLRGSNRVQVSAWVDARAERVIVMGAIDNLVKGAAGQAIQCLNALSHWDETLGLEATGLFP